MPKNPVKRLHEKKLFFRYGGDYKMSFHYQTKVSQRGNPFEDFSTGNFKDLPFLKRRKSDELSKILEL